MPGTSTRSSPMPLTTSGSASRTKGEKELR
jgi:hypothetical protein